MSLYLILLVLRCCFYNSTTQRSSALRLPKLYRRIKMENLPESLLLEILKRINGTSDRNSLALVCKHLFTIESQQRTLIRVGRGLHPANEALTSLCCRFPNLTTIEIDYSGWMYKFGKQLDDQGLLVLSSSCLPLARLTLSFCSFITDVGLGYLPSCRNLSSLKLNFAPSISANGLLSLSFGCKNLTTLHLSRCMKVKSVEWLEHLGKMGTLEDLSIKNCRGIGEGDLMKLGPGWRNLKYLEFELDKNYIDSKVYDHLMVERWQRQLYSCQQLKELRLVNCITTPSRGFSCVLGECKVLERVVLDMCFRLRDRDIASLAQNSNRLKSISLSLPSYLPTPAALDSSSTLSDDSLNALALGCSELEEVAISFPEGQFPSFSCFTLTGITTLIQNCPIRTLVLNSACFFNDSGMKALCSASHLENLEIILCQEVSDEGVIQVIHYPCLTKLTLCKCLGVTDDGLKPLIGLQKLDSLVVIGCPQVSEEGTKATARSVSYKQDLSWLF